MASGNLPSSNNKVNQTTKFFNNFFKDIESVPQNVNDAILGYFETVTGNKDSAKTLASVVLFTAIQQGLDPMLFIDELRKLKVGNKVEQRTPIENSSVNDSMPTYEQLQPIVQYGDFQDGQLFYTTVTGTFFRLRNGVLEAAPNYRVERINVGVNQFQNNYFYVTYVTEDNELNAYLTMFLNLNRINTSLLGIGNTPQTNKYIQRAILP